MVIGNTETSVSLQTSKSLKSSSSLFHAMITIIIDPSQKKKQVLGREKIATLVFLLGKK